MVPVHNIHHAFSNAVNGKNLSVSEIYDLDSLYEDSSKNKILSL